ncbi:hypothetical protein MTO96_010650 [Rhipicephalus appendiculatus]
MSGYPGNLNAGQQAALEQFRNAIADVQRTSDTDSFLLRWLRARDFDVANAQKMYRDHLKWRKENGVDDILHSYEIPEDEKFTATTRWLTWIVLKTTAANFRVMEDNYPECLEKVIVINAPSFYSMLWKFMRTLLSERTAKKFEVYGKDGWKERLLEIADADSLPACWGGDMVGPDGDPRCRHKVNYGGRFEEGGMCSVFDDKDARQQVIGRRERWELPVNVVEPGALLNWRFQTITGDVAFGLRMLSGTYLVPVQRLITCSNTPQEGSWQCDAPGTYVLEFDNTYSWLERQDFGLRSERHSTGGDILIGHHEDKFTCDFILIKNIVKMDLVC